MHMADALLSPGIAGVMYVLSGTAACLAARKVKNSEDPALVPEMGVLGAFVFAAQMLNFAIPGTGSSGHLCGGMLLAAVVGPWGGFLTLIGVLVLQCLAFGDGGLLVLGANASRQARQWERKVVRYERTHSGTGWSKKPSAESKDSKRVNKAEPVAAVTAPAKELSEHVEDAATEVMEQRQIRRALRDAEIEQAKAKALRQSAAAYQAAEEHAKQSEKSDIAQSAADKPAAEPSAMVDESADRKSAAETSESSATPDASVRTDKSIESDKSVAPRVEPSLTVRDERDERDDAAAAADATSELVSVRPARALDVFDMSTSQDLISFTLGGEHNADNAPESLEIKSTRQVSKAEPVEPAVAEKLIDEARAVKAADDAKAVSAGNAVDTEPEQRDDADTDADDEAANAAQRAAFHESEERADVEAPAATTDSLGAGLDSILARRGN